MRTDPYRKQLDKLQAERRYALRSLSEAREALQEAQVRREEAKTAQALVQGIAEQVQQRIHERIASLATRCLQAVFQEPYRLRLDFRQARGKTEACLVLEKGDVELEDPLHEEGGGVVDVCSFALRLACLLLSRPARRRLLVLDEPAKHLSKEYRPRFRRLLEGLAEELDVQIVMVTHSKLLAAGKVVRL